MIKYARGGRRTRLPYNPNRYREINEGKEYRLQPKTAIKRFFNKNSQLSDFRETFEYMNSNGINHYIMYVDGSYFENPTYEQYSSKRGVPISYSFILEEPYEGLTYISLTKWQERSRRKKKK